MIGSVIAAPGSIEGLIYLDVPLRDHLIGLPEVTVQMLLFSWLIWAWERRASADSNVP